jgi:hypothetical protein
VDPWLARVRHDLVKYAVWRARDLRDRGGEPTPEDLRALERGLRELRDPDGATVDAVTLFRRLRAERPAPDTALDAFERAVIEADVAVRDLGRRPVAWRGALAAVLSIEDAFDEMARTLKRP